MVRNLRHSIIKLTFSLFSTFFLSWIWIFLCPLTLTCLWIFPFRNALGFSCFLREWESCAERKAPRIRNPTEEWWRHTHARAHWLSHRNPKEFLEEWGRPPQRNRWRNWRLGQNYWSKYHLKLLRETNALGYLTWSIVKLAVKLARSG